MYEASCIYIGTRRACDCNSDRLWVRIGKIALRHSAESGERELSLTLGFQVPSAYPAMCGIQREDKITLSMLNLYVFFILSISWILLTVFLLRLKVAF